MMSGFFIMRVIKQERERERELCVCVCVCENRMVNYISIKRVYEYYYPLIQKNLIEIFQL